MGIKKSTTVFVVAAILFHVIMLVSLIDLHTITRGDGEKTPQFYPLRPPARRVVVLVANGVTADAIFSVNEEEGENTRAPFLRGVATRAGRWGVSHAHPLADWYQAVFAGVSNERSRSEQYDSLFNAAEHTLYWGTPQSEQQQRMLMSSERSKVVDVSKQESTTTISQITSSLERALDPNSVTYSKLLSEEKLLFFFEFNDNLSAGFNEPFASSHYIKQIDSAVEKIANLIDSFYNDRQTAFMFTSSANNTFSSVLLHGHHIEFVHLPFICWGAGIKKARSSQQSSYHYVDGLAERWQMSKYERVDIHQKDTASLIATLIGVHIPVDSEGALPVGYIHYNREFDANTLFANARQLAELVRVKEEIIKSHSLPFLFQPFASLTKTAREEQMVAIDELIKQRKLQESIHSSKQLIALCKSALNYYQTYHQTGLKLILVAGYAGWIACVIAVLVQNAAQHGHKPTKRMLFVSPIGLMVCGVLCLLQMYQGAPLLYCVYVCVPIVCWDYVIARKTLFLCCLNTAAQDPTQFLKTMFAGVFLVSCAVLVAISSIIPHVLAVLLFLLAVWPYVDTDMTQRNQWKHCICWTISCFCLAVTPLLFDSLNTIITTLTYMAVLAVCLVLLINPESRHLIATPRSLTACNFLIVIILQVVVLCFAWLYLQVTPCGISVNSQYFTVFCVIVTTVSLPLVGSKSIIGRLIHVFLSLETVLVAFGASKELTFTAILAAALITWLRVEDLVTADQQKVTSVWYGILCLRKTEVVTLVPGDERVAKIGLLSEEMRRIGFLIVFGTYSFTTALELVTSQCSLSLSVFTVVLAGAVASIPLLSVICVYNVILCVLNQSMRIPALLWVVTMDTIGLFLFLLISSRGDLQETVTGISMYVGVVCAMLWTCVLFVLACLLTGRSVVPRKLEEHSL